MSNIEELNKKYEKPVFEYLPLNKIVIPDLRVTAEMPEDLQEQFKESIKTAGIKNPLKIVFDNGKYILVDGLHRLLEAKMANQETVPCVIVKGTLKEAMLENLSTGKLQGRGKATDMIKVIKYLHDEEKMTVEDIARLSGYKREYLYDLLSIANAHPDLLMALDEEKITLGAAKELARIPVPDVMLKLLYEVIYRRMKNEDVKELVNLTLEAMEMRKKREEEMKKRPPKEYVPIQCWVCGEEAPAKDMVTFVLCPKCQAVLFSYKAELRAAMMRQPEPPKIEEKMPENLPQNALNNEEKAEKSREIEILFSENKTKKSEEKIG